MLMRNAFVFYMLLQATLLIASATPTERHKILLGERGYSLVPASAGSDSSFLGTGATSNVFRVGHESQSDDLVAKVFKEGFLPNMCFPIEADLLKDLDHPNIVKLYEAVEDYSSKVLILGYAGSIELYDFIVDSQYASELKEHRKSIIKQLVDAISYLHDQGIILCDLKLDNIMLLKNSVGEYLIKIIDLGLAQKLSDGYTTTVKGTIQYLAPETFTARCKLDGARDMWALGVIIHTMYAELFPFETEDLEEAAATYGYAGCGAERFDWSFKGKDLLGALGDSAEMDDLMAVLSRLLAKKPEDRMTAEEFSAHPWLGGVSNPAMEEVEVAEEEAAAGAGSGVSVGACAGAGAGAA